MTPISYLLAHTLYNDIFVSIIQYNSLLTFKYNTSLFLRVPMDTSLVAERATLVK